MNVRRLDDPAAFLETASPLLLEDEARHNLMLGIGATLRDEPAHYPERRLWLVEDGPDVVGAALQTPPHNLVVARPSEEAAVEALAASIDDDLPGVNGAVPEVDRFAAAWSAKTGVRPRTTFAQGLFQLDRVEPVSGVSGAMREAVPEDRELLIEWWQAFADEALGDSAVESAADAVDHRLSAREAGAVIWEDGEPVSSAAFGGPTPNGIRIGPVYTPPEHRRHGYASAVTAGLSSRLLESRRFCFLYTDLANPTSNKIYEQIGYRRVCEAASIAFDQP
jgi:predicted GNAT family acetyltransferase